MTVLSSLTSSLPPSLCNALPTVRRRRLIINNFMIFCNHTALVLCFRCLQLGPPHRCPLGPSHHKPCPMEAILLLTAFSAAPMHEPSAHVCHTSTAHFATSIYGTFCHKHLWHISPQTSTAHFAHIHSAFRHKHPRRISPQPSTAHAQVYTCTCRQVHVRVCIWVHRLT